MLYPALTQATLLNRKTTLAAGETSVEIGKVPPLAPTQKTKSSKDKEARDRQVGFGDGSLGVSFYYAYIQSLSLDA